MRAVEGVCMRCQRIVVDLGCFVLTVMLCVVGSRHRPTAIGSQRCQLHKRYPSAAALQRGHVQPSLGCARALPRGCRPGVKCLGDLSGSCAWSLSAQPRVMPADLHQRGLLSKSCYWLSAYVPAVSGEFTGSPLCQHG